MKNNSNLKSRLRQYSAIAAVTIAATPAVNAQVIYSDLDPDIVIEPGEHYWLNLTDDGDATFFFANFTTTFNGNLYLDMYAYNGLDYGGKRMLVYHGGEYGGVLHPLPYGYVINGGATNWKGGGGIASNNTNGSAVWANQEGYVGLKFHQYNNEAGNHWGWVRMKVNLDPPDNISIVLKDFAFNATKGEKILAGEGRVNECADSFEPNNSFSTAQEINTLLPVLSMINPADDKDFYKFTVGAIQPNIRLALSGLPKNYNMSLYDASKQQIASSTNKRKEDEVIIYNAAPAGTYYVKVFPKGEVFDANDCYNLLFQTSSSSFRQSNENENAVQPNIILFPNPADNFLFLQINGNAEGASSITIYDLEGRAMMEVSPQTGTQVKLDISALPQGMYVAKVVAGSQVIVKKFIVQK